MTSSKFNFNAVTKLWNTHTRARARVCVCIYAKISFLNIRL